MGADYPRGPPTSAPRSCRARVPRALATLSRQPPGQRGRSPHTRGGGETLAAEPRASDHSPQRAEPSSSNTTRGHISAPNAGSPPPQVSGAGAAAVTGRTDRRLPSQSGPGAQAAWPRAGALPPPHTRSPSRAGRARALGLAPSPPRVLLTRRLPDSRLRVPTPASSRAVARAGLPGHALPPQSPAPPSVSPPPTGG